MSGFDPTRSYSGPTADRVGLPWAGLSPEPGGPVPKPTLTRQPHHAASDERALDTRVEAGSCSSRWSRSSEGCEGVVWAFSGRAESISATLPAAIAIRSRSWGERTTSDEPSSVGEAVSEVARLTLAECPVLG